MTSLEHVPEDWTRALAVVAHPDDLEYGAAGAIARWTAQGKQVTYCLVTAGEAGIDTLPPDECARLRMDDERRSAACVGVSEVEFLAHPDGLVEASLVLRRDLTAVIRRTRPDVLISINHRDEWPGGVNHADRSGSSSPSRSNWCRSADERLVTQAPVPQGPAGAGTRNRRSCCAMRR